MREPGIRPADYVIPAVVDGLDRCRNCERCTWNPGDDCGGWSVEHLPDGSTRPVGERHSHCERCGHCRGRHVPGEDWSWYWDHDLDWDA